MTGGATAAAAGPEAEDALLPRLPPAALLWLGLFWFAMSFHWGALITVVIPAEVLRFVPEAQKGTYLGALFAAGAVMAMFVSPIAGALSDRSTLRMGRRRPFVIGGVLVNCAGLLLMRSAGGYGAYVAGFAVVQTASNFAGGAFNGLIPDKVPPNQRGLASGIMGFMMLAGTICAALLAGTLAGRGQIPAVYVIDILVFLVCTTLVVAFIEEDPLRAAAPFDPGAFLRSFWIDPRRYPNFGWMFLTRGLVMLGFYSLVSFLQFFIKDLFRLSVAQAARTTGVLSAVTIASGTITALGAGWLSDRIGRRGIVSASGIFLAVTGAGLLAGPSFSVLVGIAVLFGIGYGAFTSVDWALAMDVLPSRASAAKDLGIWAIANSLPQVLAPVLAGPVLDAFNRRAPLLGYNVVFGASIAYVIAGSLLVWRIKGVR